MYCSFSISLHKNAATNITPPSINNFRCMVARVLEFAEKTIINP